MPSPLHNLFHSLDAGRGRSVILALMTCMGVLLLSLFMDWKQSTGPQDEAAIEPLTVARSIVRGQGFSTPVRHPQAVARLMARGWHFDPQGNVPDLYHAPLHPLLMAGAFAVAGDGGRKALFADPVSANPGVLPGYRADAFLLGLNTVLFWITLLLSWLLGRRLFNPAVGWVALLALLLSGGMWDAVFRLDASLLLADLLLGLALLLTALRAEAPAGRVGAVAMGAGVVVALVFLTNYAAVIPALVLALAACALVLPWARLRLALPLVLLFAVLPALPWLIRNVQLAGSPLGLAGQSMALVAGDPTAEPEDAMAALSPETPDVNLRKSTHKWIDGIHDLVAGGLYSGGAYLFAVLCVAGGLYRFRSAEAAGLHRAFLLALVAAVLTLPFLSAGLAAARMGVWLAPLMIVFGAAFLFVLVESTADRPEWQVRAMLALALMVQAVPLLNQLGPTMRRPFTYPPYIPAYFALTRQQLVDHRPPQYAMMADIPAGVAWYADTRVWQQPADYADFARIQKIQYTPTQLISAHTLNRPWLSELGAGAAAADTWGAVYAGLPQRQVPWFHPLRRVIPLQSNLYVLTD